MPVDTVSNTLNVSAYTFLQAVVSPTEGDPVAVISCVTANACDITQLIRSQLGQRHVQCMY